ncbi:5'-deoxynucleotidase [Shewanella sp. NIFS-20-20]|uniref:5'-deoxynucleotidase n=1 Tax=Shewanella sp. NIFS-20-20 TaxID=2853806 RepID=UPI001C45F77B|nr:5'-deoxynucleotidase [Shewanella sp. NIFS-20-20]MBV7315193.1 5'-deoxynucleotidase [Shewanella sp. NIFS-20-20]
MSHFFAHMARMKLIQRWPLMHNVRSENVQEHSLQVAMVSHALAVISNQYHQAKFDPYRAATIAIYHDASEVLTGDLPTPVKYFNHDIEAEYKKIEAIAERHLLNMLPEPLQDDFKALLVSTDIPTEYKALVKSADTLCAYLKCLEEGRAGNDEFITAKRRLEDRLTHDPLPAVKDFIHLFIPSFRLNLDQINQML